MKEFKTTPENKGEIIDAILKRDIEGLRAAAGKDYTLRFWRTVVGEPGFVDTLTGKHHDAIPEEKNVWRIIVRHPAPVKK